MILKIKTHFDAAHKLQNYDGKCSNLHGHRWEVVFSFRGPVNTTSGMMVDFSVIKPMVNSILPDHSYLNEVYDLSEPTAERLVCCIFNDTTKALAELNLGVELERVELFESPECSVVLDNRRDCCCQ